MATPLLPISLLLVLFQHLLTASSSVPFARTIDDPEQELGLRLTQPKLTHFRFYWHDIQSGERPTSVPIVKPKSPSGFGGVNMIDNPLTEGPEKGSKVVGRAQGMYALASQQEIGLLMAQNLVLLEDMYNGSVLTVVGRNSVYNKVREMPVVGGSGVFRFARGYVEARTYSFDPKTQDAVVRYDCFVLLHY